MVNQKQTSIFIVPQSEKTNSTINRNPFNEKLYELKLGLIAILFQCRYF